MWTGQKDSIEGGSNDFRFIGRDGDDSFESRVFVEDGRFFMYLVHRVKLRDSPGSRGSLKSECGRKVDRRERRLSL